MSSTEPRVQAVPAVSNPEILAAQAVSAAQNLEIMRVLAVNVPEILPALSSTPVDPTERILLQLSLSLSAKQWA